MDIAEIKKYEMIEFLDINHTAINDYLKEKQPSLLLIITDENTHEHCQKL